ncbi:chemotaxis protein CheB [Dyella solisilvae]|uniref:protein-glutamate methylesterase n=1 Tax=Dyella solisilvae TaxID=1920168 RepID=A0A370KC42_9GAMM|nr:chemotaxis protein CheB [Dyella solisilvae]RDJ00217.1 chemotaxis protein CheB [Dyella solisilvae]
MAESAIAVALLFDDIELGGQLRAALDERGARIVHEGALSTLSRALLERTGAEVLVVNLDEEADDELDRLYEVIDGDRPRVVFNDAQASRRLDGWDRARWARHLAVKVMAQGDLDPPRPQHAPVVAQAPEVALAEVAPAAREPVAVEAESYAFDVPADLALDDMGHQPALVEEAEVEAESESLAAELEALLAADEPVSAHDDFGDGLKFGADDDLPPLHDGSFGLDSLPTQGPAPVPEVSAEPAVRPMPSFQLDHLALAPIDDSFMPATTAASAPGAEPSSLFNKASSWSLVDADDAPATSSKPVESKAADFGIEKLSAADFLAPEGGEEAESFLQPGMTLELVSIEEAIAPSATYEGGHEMMLDALDSAIGRVLVLGAAADSAEAVCTFLSRLPASLRMTVVHVQHLEGKSAEVVAEQLARYSEMPVRVAAHGARARTGEVLVVPEGQQVRLYRDGRVELQSLAGLDLQSSPIDASFTMAANVFGRNAQAIVFAGHANDALGGCQAIHDRGGQVWVEASSEGHFADMVNGIEAERLNSYAGTPPELAARLVEEMLMEGRR